MLLKFPDQWCIIPMQLNGSNSMETTTLHVQYNPLRAHAVIQV